jgi:hypothetical protein
MPQTAPGRAARSQLGPACGPARIVRSADVIGAPPCPRRARLRTLRHVSLEQRGPAAPGWSLSDAAHRAERLASAQSRGCGTIRMYGFGAFQPPGNFAFAASSDTDGTMITSSPFCQLTGVAT